MSAQSAGHVEAEARRYFEALARPCHDANAAAKAAAIYADPELTNEAKLRDINDVLELYGVEAIRAEGAHVDRYHYDIIASYVNTGDTYTPTVVHDHETGELILTSMGDWYEGWLADQ